MDAELPGVIARPRTNLRHHDHRPGAEILAQDSAFIICAAQAAALQLRHYHRNEAPQQPGRLAGVRLDVTGPGLAPLLHKVGDVRDSADPRRSRNARTEVFVELRLRLHASVSATPTLPVIRQTAETMC
jgi:hypothetical protein